ncbi:IS3 family transposase [Streptomyces sp. MB09-02B]|uniref:IS3 family transposase n=1 Tax=Streptomyces sp. MB09-02B TaxID=3028667 RepID=UPI0039B06930
MSESGYYAWRSRPPSPRSLRHSWLTEAITTIHTASHGTYGIRRVHAELRLGHGIPVSHGTVMILMQRAGIKGLPGNRRRRPRHDTPHSRRPGRPQLRQDHSAVSYGQGFAAVRCPMGQGLSGQRGVTPERALTNRGGRYPRSELRLGARSRGPGPEVRP